MKIGKCKKCYKRSAVLHCHCYTIGWPRWEVRPGFTISTTKDYFCCRKLAKILGHHIHLVQGKGHWEILNCNTVQMNFVLVGHFKQNTDVFQPTPDGEEESWAKLAKLFPSVGWQRMKVETLIIFFSILDCLDCSYVYSVSLMNITRPHCKPPWKDKYSVNNFMVRGKVKVYLWR